MNKFPRSGDPWEQDVWLMAQRMALLYYHMATAIVDRLGKDEGEKLVKEAVWAYGEACGCKVREGVVDQGLPLEPANYSKIPDLPSKGWRGVLREGDSSDSKKIHATVFCPLAAIWRELGAEKLGRLYCFVDQAKFHAYNPDLRVTHTRNVLDGDDCCVIDVRREK